MANIEIKGVIGDEYSYKQFITDYAMAKGEPVNLLIDSPGGAVTDGELIAEFIRSHSDNFIRVSNTGDVASIAASIFLSLPYEKRFFDLSKGVALIHNPFIDPFSLMYGDTTAAGLKTASDEVLDVEKRISKYITLQTGADADVISALMAINEPLTESQLESINFANIIKFKAVAYFNNNNKNDEMKKEEVEELLETKNESLFQKIVALFKPAMKAIMLTTSTGEQVEFPGVQEGTEVQVGDAVNAPDGDLLMADGSTIVVVAGKVTEIKPKAIETAPNAEIEELKAEIERLKSESAGYKAEADEYAAIKAQLSKIQSKMEVEEREEREAPGDGKFKYNGRKK